ncbi:MAG: DUF938 domain-containing protein [Cyanobacteria bacterium J06623_7]
MMDERQYAPATQRNREPILKILSEVIPPQSNILEIASGTGEHAVFLSSRLQSSRWIPSDASSQALESIAAWRNTSSSDNLDLPLSIDVARVGWQQQLVEQEIDVVVNINMIHISPWQACLGLLVGVEQILAPGGILYLYGPFKREGKHTAPSNASFDLSLRDRNPLWGVRDLEAVVDAAADQNLKLERIIPMPANNLSVIFSR